MAAILVAVVSLALAPVASGQTIAPPGNSGIEQYLETVPTAKGNAKPKGGKRRGPELPARTQERLQQAGEDGRRLLEAVQQTAPEAARRAAAAQGGERRREQAGERRREQAGERRREQSGGERATARRSGTADEDASGSGGSAKQKDPEERNDRDLLASAGEVVLNGEGEGGGMGRALPATLVISALAIGLLALRRRWAA